VDDEKNYLWMLGELFQTAGHEVLTAEKAAEALKLLQQGHVDVLITDLRLAEMDGMALVAQARDMAGPVSTIVMTAYGSIERAVEAMKLGAYDFILKPFNHADLLRTVEKALERTALVRENVRLARTLASEHHVDELIGTSTAMRLVVEQIKRVAHGKSTVLISGESGAGKELVARAIHFSGPRCGRAFLPVNCASFTESLAESELFGHERGAFTGAAARHPGLFEQAHGGTLFLDEIGELPANLQTKLLRVLDTQELRRVGSERAIAVDVRILAATNRDLKAEVKAGRFRDDLLFRLNVVKIVVPPLRERREDIPLLAEAYLERLVREGSGRGRRISVRAMELLSAHDWPGNVRELQNVVAHAALMAREDLIQPEDLPVEVTMTTDWLSALERILPEQAPLDDTVKAMEHHLIIRALSRTNGVRSKAAALLKISPSLLQYKLKVMGLASSSKKASTE
jgi:two-component system NtrC family response regulator